MRLLAPAKINLFLRVGPPRDDGYHGLLSWMCTVGLFDILAIDPGSGDGVDLQCDDPQVPCDRGNLVVKAAAGLAEAVSQTRDACTLNAGLSVRLQKRIPVGAGLGGGSSDGACMLQALNQLWRLKWPAQELADFSAGLGSDLPFFFFAPSALCAGRGERVRPLSPPRPQAVLLVLPPRPMPTAAVYRRFDQMNLGDSTVINTEPDLDRWLSLDAAGLLPMLVNDLEPAAFSIDAGLGDLRAELEQRLLRPVRMSGSGSSLFTLYDNLAEAQTAAVRINGCQGAKAMAVRLAVRGEVPG